MSTNIFNDFDEQGQEELQGYNFISFEDLQRGIIGTDPFEGIRTNKIRLGETIRGMTNVHPFVTQKFHNRVSREISKYYFPDAEKKFLKEQGVSFDIDVDCDNVGDLLIDSIPFFIDKNNNNQKDNNEQSFTLRVYASKNPKKLKEAFECVYVEQGEVLLFIEDNTDDLSKQWVRIKIADDIRESIKNSHFYDNAVINAINQNVEFSQDHLKQLVETGQIVEQMTFAKSLVTGLWYVVMAVSSPVKAVGWIVSKIGEWIGVLKLPDKVWDTQHEDYLFDKDNLISLLTIDTKKLGNLESDLNTKAPGFDWYDLIPDFVKEKIAKVIAHIKSLIDKWNAFISKHIADNHSIDEEFQSNLAFKVGLYNGIIDFISSTLQFLGGLAEAPFDVANNWQEFLETIDNILLSIRNINFSQLFVLAPVYLVLLLTSLKDIESEDIDWIRIAYIIGFAIAFVGTMFIPIAGWVGKVVKLSKLIPEELLVAMQKGLTYVKGKNPLQSALRTIENIFEIFAKGKESILEFVDKLKKIIVTWFKTNKKQFINKIKVGSTLLNKIKLIKGLTITAEKGTYTFKYFDVLIKSGTKPQVERAVNGLFVRGEKVARKKLNLLVFGTRIPRFGKEFIAHLRYGHVTVSKINGTVVPKQVVEKYKYIIGKGGKNPFTPPYSASANPSGVHIYKYFNTTNRRIKEVKETFKLQNGDEVVKVRVEVFIKELSNLNTRGWKVKGNTSTLFPKNWSDYKIERTIKEAMDNIYFKSKNRFKGKAKDGTKIEFYYSKTQKGVNTAYIIK
ncbi:EndoU domain-containing protein [Winogradskyella sp.]|jgi:hypothetical protein|uniref:EndoU domain-containing protein n=1 Tax=Winogradskyella sp. TaxID=1883156 RepID=UPI0025F5B3D7|nr:EndoU domain-containing protein [Winogradskyella sp.]MCT4629478.1 EndoU domain-containing protein [Winogradskyella sp.]